MTSNIQMEKLWQRYQEEGVAHNLSMQEFCSLNSNCPPTYPSWKEMTKAILPPQQACNAPLFTIPFA